MTLFEYNEEQHLENVKQEGHREGYQSLLVGQVCKKMRKGKSVEEIADELEESEKEIQCIYEVAKELVPGYEEEKVIAKYIAMNTDKE